MGEMVNFDNTNGGENNSEIVSEQNNLMAVAEDMLASAREQIKDEKTISVPINQLSALGTGISSLIPALNQVTQSTTIREKGLYRLANADVGDVLKKAKDGNFWGAFKTQGGNSKMLKISEAGPLTATTTTTVPVNPATMMMAVALFSVDQKLGDIAEMQKKILSFLETEKESEIEADVETLMNIITKFKNNWDNEHYVSSNHKMVLDIQRTCRKNMLTYQKKLEDAVDSKKLIVAQNMVKSTVNDLIKKFKYYRLSLYSYAMASLIEIMLSGNFKEENFNGAKADIEKYSDQYRELFSKCSVSLEKLSKSSIETNLMKGIGGAGKAVGKFFGSIPFIKESPVDEFLQDGGKSMIKSAKGIEADAVKSFAKMNNPNTRVFIDHMEKMNQIYNHTSGICFDSERIYLVA